MSAKQTKATATKQQLKYWQIDAGNSTDGPVGFVLRGIRAATKEQALEIVQGENYLLPEDIQLNTSDEDDEAQPHVHLSVYFNARALTVADVEEDEFTGDDDEEEGDDDTH